MLFKLLETNIFHKNVVTFNTLGPIYLVKTVKCGINFPSQVMLSELSWPKCSVGEYSGGLHLEHIVMVLKCDQIKIYLLITQAVL